VWNKNCSLPIRIFLRNKKDEFKIEDQYEYRAVSQKIRYKKVWHPVFCQSATLTNFKGFNYLIGGVNHSVIKQVWALDENNPEFTWSIVKDDKEVTLQRYGHTCNVYKNSLVIFGGQKGSGNKKTKRIVLNDLWLYKPQNGELTQILAKSCPDLRYGHWAWVAGDYLLIYGGINEMGEVLSDTWIFDFDANKWIKVQMTEHNKRKDTPPGMWFSGIVSVFYKGRKDNADNDFFQDKYVQDQNIDPFLPKSKREKLKDQEIVLEGFYMFGGITLDNDIVNDLFILKVEQNGTKFEWEKVKEYNGKPPCERCHHYMEYFEFNNSIVIHGGRNDNQSVSSVLDDMYFLQTDTLTWIKVEFVNKKPGARFSHAWTIQNTKLVIFGGVGSNFGMEQSIEAVELNPEKFGENYTNILH